MKQNWIVTLYDGDDEIIEQLIVKDRTEWEARNEAINFMSLHAINPADWSLMRESFWIAEKFDTSNLEEI